MKTLLLPDEVVNFTPISIQFPRCDLRTLYGIEFNEGLNCLGMHFYNELLGDLVDYSGVLPYAQATSYNTGDLVAYKGVIYTALEDSLQGIIPTTINKWEPAPKFNKECFEKLWCNHLGEYLSWVVIRNRLPFISTQVTAEGLVKKIGEHFEAASDKDFHTVQKAVIAQVDRAFTNMHAYIMANNGNHCYDKYKGIIEQSDCGDNVDCKEAKKGNYAYRIG